MDSFNPTKVLLPCNLKGKQGRSNMHNFDILAKHRMEKNEVENLKLHSITTVCSNNNRAKSKDAILSEINQISSYQALFRPKSLQ